MHECLLVVVLSLLRMATITITSQTPTMHNAACAVHPKRFGICDSNAYGTGIAVDKSSHVNCHDNCNILHPWLRQPCLGNDVTIIIIYCFLFLIHDDSIVGHDIPTQRRRGRSHGSSVCQVKLEVAGSLTPPWCAP